MQQYNLLQDYVLIEEISQDAFGKSFLAKKVVDNKPAGNYLVVRLHRYISDHPENIDNLRKYTAEINKSTVTNILRPEDIFVHDGEILLVYPLVKGKNLKSVIDGMERRKTNLAFKDIIAMILKIAHLEDTGSAVILNDRPSYHGFLIPENVLVDYEGEIYLKYYGMLPYISSSSYTYIKSNYKIWLAPELLRRGEIHYRSEIYYLGHIVYRLLTGKYFSVEPTDFEQAVTNISFNIALPTTDTGFISSLLEFFQKTLHPEVDQRLASFDEFTTFITDNFGVTNTYFVKPPLAKMLNKLYPPKVRDGDTVPIAELLNNRDKTERRTVRQGISAEDLKKKLAAEGEPRKSRALPVIILIAVLGIIAVITLILLDSSREVTGRTAPVEMADNRQPDTGEIRKEESLSPENKITDESPRLPDQSDVSKKTPAEEISVGKGELPGESDETAVLERKPPADSSDGEKSQATTEMAKPATEPVGGGKLTKDASTLRPESDSEPAAEPAKEGSPADKSPSREMNREPEESQAREEQRKKSPETPQKKEIPLVELPEVTRKPVKISGDISFSAAIRRNYPGRRRTLDFSLLIDEEGTVREVRLHSSLPEDLAEEVTRNLQSWRYRPPRRNGDPVRVWIRDSCRIEIR